MEKTTIYQTLEDRDNDEEVQAHGPYWCDLYEADGKKKEGIKEPWLGAGYYFWDTLIENAHWWGETIYLRKKANYIICQSQYDSHSPHLFDLVGNVSHYREFVDCVAVMKSNGKGQKRSFPEVLAYLKQHADFRYKAVRARPHPLKFVSANIYFPGGQMELEKLDKVQICFFDKSLFIAPFEIVERSAGLSIQFEFSSKRR